MSFGLNEFEYQLAGTGTVARTLAARLRELPSILDYEDVFEGPGSADSTAGIQAALDDNAGGALFIPRGWFNISDQLDIPAGTRLYGLGPGSYLRVTDPNAPGALKLNGDFITVENLKVERSNLATAPNGYIGIQVPAGSYDGKIVDCFVWMPNVLAGTYGIKAEGNGTDGAYWLEIARPNIVGGEYGIYGRAANNAKLFGGNIQSKYGLTLLETGNFFFQGVNLGGGNNHRGLWLQSGTVNTKGLYTFEGNGNGADTEAYRDEAGTAGNFTEAALGGPLGNKVIQVSKANRFRPIDYTGVQSSDVLFDLTKSVTFAENTWVDTGITSDDFAFDGFYRLGVVNLENWQQGGVIFNYYALIDLPVVKATNSTETVTLNTNHTSQSNNGDAISWRIQKDAASGTGKFKLQVRITGASARTYTGATAVKYRVERVF
jgi:hypothetical protein